MTKKKWPYKTGSIPMNLFMTGQEKVDLLIQVSMFLDCGVKYNQSSQ